MSGTSEDAVDAAHEAFSDARESFDQLQHVAGRDPERAVGLAEETIEDLEAVIEELEKV